MNIKNKHSQSFNVNIQAHTGLNVYIIPGTQCIKYSVHFWYRPYSSVIYQHNDSQKHLLSAHLLVCTLNPKQAQYPSGYVILTIIKHSFTLVENVGAYKIRKTFENIRLVKILSLKLVIYTTLHMPTNIQNRIQIFTWKICESNI